MRESNFVIFVMFHLLKIGTLLEWKFLRRLARAWKIVHSSTVFGQESLNQVKSYSDKKKEQIRMFLIPGTGFVFVCRTYCGRCQPMLASPITRAQECLGSGECYEE